MAKLSLIGCLYGLVEPQQQLSASLPSHWQINASAEGWQLQAEDLAISIEGRGTGTVSGQLTELQLDELESWVQALQQQQVAVQLDVHGDHARLLRRFM